MPNTKKTSAKKASAKSTSKAPVKKAQSFSSKDEKLLMQTLDLVNNLNSEISKVQKAKTKLESDISKLSKKADTISPEVEIEIQKAKSEITSKSNKTKKDLDHKISELEDRIRKVLKVSEEIKRTVSKVDHSKLSEEIFVGVEKKINGKINLALKKLKEQNKHVEELLFKYHLETQSRNALVETQVEEKVEEILKAAQKTLKDVRTEEEKNAQFLVNKVNEVIDNVNGFEDYYKSLERKSIDGIKKEVEVSFNRVKNKFLEDVKQKDVNYSKELAKFKIESSEHIKALVQELSREYEQFKKKIQDYEKDKFEFMEYAEKDKKVERDLIVSKYNELMEKANQTEIEIVDLIHKNRLSMEQKINEEIDNAKVAVKEEFARLVVTNNDALTRLNTETKTKHRELSEEIDSKLSTSKNQIDKKFTEILDRHELALAQKEKEYLQKLDLVEQERKKVMTDMNSFKTEMANLTKEYVSSMDEELKKIKIEEKSFKADQKKFEEELNEIVAKKKEDLEEASKEAQIKVKDVLEEERKAFERHEETFRDVFNKKVQNLQEYDKNRLDKIEKKFVEKNLKYVQEEVDKHVEPIKLMSESIIAKEETLNKRIDEINMKEDALLADLHSHEDALKEKVEERIMNLEQNLNKRFLDLDSDFTNFKGVVVDEVEDLMKEVNELINQKVEDANTMISKLNFANSEMSKKMSEFDNFYNGITDETKNLREDLNDLRVKHEMGAGASITSMNKLVSMMADYEDNLVSLVTSLKQRGVADDEIAAALRDKGHPMMYVEMVLNSLNHIKN